MHFSSSSGLLIDVSEQNDNDYEGENKSKVKLYVNLEYP